MQLQNHQDISGFVKKNYEILGISKRSLYRRVQLYNAIEDKIFGERTINSFRNEKITYSQLLNKLRKIENKRKMRNNLEASKTFQLEIPSSSNKLKRIKEEKPISKDSPKILPVVEKERDTELFKNCKYPYDTSRSTISYNQLEKVEKVSLNKEYENTLKIKQVNKSVKERSYQKKKNNTNKNNQDESKVVVTTQKKTRLISSQSPSSIKQMYVCKRCSKATVIPKEYKCEKYGHHNLDSTVLCDEDIINGFHKLRDPNALFCEKSPDYDLLKKLFV